MQERAVGKIAIKSDQTYKTKKAAIEKLKLDLTKDAKMHHISMVQLQLDSIQIVNFIEVTIKQLPFELTKNKKCKKLA